MPSRVSGPASPAPARRWTGQGARNCRVPPAGTTTAACCGRAARAARHAANWPSATPVWQPKPCAETASAIFRASASSPPKYRAGPRAPRTHIPGRSTSTTGQNSSTAVTTRPKARVSLRPAASAGQSGHHTARIRAGRPVLPAFTGRPVPRCPRRRPGPSRAAAPPAAAGRTVAAVSSMVTVPSGAGSHSHRRRGRPAAPRPSATTSARQARRLPCPWPIPRPEPLGHPEPDRCAFPLAGRDQHAAAPPQHALQPAAGLGERPAGRPHHHDLARLQHRRHHLRPAAGQDRVPASSGRAPPPCPPPRPRPDRVRRPRRTTPRPPMPPLSAPGTAARTGPPSAPTPQPGHPPGAVPPAREAPAGPRYGEAPALR